MENKTLILPKPDLSLSGLITKKIRPAMNIAENQPRQRARIERQIAAKQLSPVYPEPVVEVKEEIVEKPKKVRKPRVKKVS